MDNHWDDDDDPLRNSVRNPINTNDNNNNNDNIATVSMNDHLRPRRHNEICRKFGNKKSKTHRKKHVPAGPAGVWFQTQQQQQQQQQNSDERGGKHHGRKRDRESINNNNSEHQEDEDDDDENEISRNQKQQQQQQQKSSSTQHQEQITSFNPVWTAVECALGFATPHCPPWLTSSQRYSLLRPYIPERYVLIRDLLSMQKIWNLPSDRRILVMVHSIQSLMAEHYLWTVGLMDESGSFVQAWVQPNFVQQEQQRSVPQYLRLGNVWMLSDVTFQLVANNQTNRNTLHLSSYDDDKDEDDDDISDDKEDDIITSGYNHLERTLLITESNIENVWTPASEKDLSSETYIQWLEKRNSATLESSSTTTEDDQYYYQQQIYLRQQHQYDRVEVEVESSSLLKNNIETSIIMDHNNKGNYEEESSSSQSTTSLCNKNESMDFDCVIVNNKENIINQSLEESSSLEVDNTAKSIIKIQSQMDHKLDCEEEETSSQSTTSVHNNESNNFDCDTINKGNISNRSNVRNSSHEADNNTAKMIVKNQSQDSIPIVSEKDFSSGRDEEKVTEQRNLTTTATTMFELSTPKVQYNYQTWMNQISIDDIEVSSPVEDTQTIHHAPVISEDSLQSTSSFSSSSRQQQEFKAVQFNDHNKERTKDRSISPTKTTTNTTKPIFNLWENPNPLLAAMFEDDDY